MNRLQRAWENCPVYWSCGDWNTWINAKRWRKCVTLVLASVIAVAYALILGAVEAWNQWRGWVQFFREEWKL